jgi:hypothetical protein
MSEENRYVTEAGTFMAKVKMPGNGWFGESGKKKTPFIRIPLLITDGPQKGREIADLISSLNSLSKAAASEAQEEEDAPERKPKAKAKKVDEKYEGRTHSDEGDEIPF